MNYCLRSKEKDGDEVKGVEITMREKIVVLKNESGIIDELEHKTFPFRCVSLLFRRLCQCERCNNI